VGPPLTKSVFPLAALLGALLALCPARAEEGGPVAPPAPGREAIDRAIERGVAWVLGEQKPDGTWGSKGDALGHTSLAVYALLHAGLGGSGEGDAERRFARALKFVDRTGPGRPDARDLDPGTYTTSLLLLLLADRGREEDRPRLQRLVDLLARTQSRNGQWNYQGVRDVGDNSNTQFAVLAVGAAVGEGLEVPKKTLEAADAWWRSSAQKDGGFGYSSGGSTASRTTGSMTAAGIACLAILACARTDPASEAPFLPLADPVLRAAVERLGKGFAVDRNEGPAHGQVGQRQRNAGQGWLHYYLWTVERAMVLAGLERIVERDWYREGVAHLLATQYKDGSWRGESPFYATCFALLFLTRAAAPPRAFTPRDGSGTPVTPGAEPPKPDGAGAALPPTGTVADWLREGVAPDELRARCLAAGSASLRPLVRALGDSDPKVRQRAFEALSALLPPDRVEGADRHPLARGRLDLWVRRAGPWLRVDGTRFAPR
jgi:hypothetical protein